MSAEGGNSGPNFQITSQANLKAALVKRLKEVRIAIELWQQSSMKQITVPTVSRINAPQLELAVETEQLATAFVSHLSETQETLLAASNLLNSESKISNIQSR